jgi:hypothetical protein
MRCAVVTAASVLFSVTTLASAGSWADWEKYRDQVRHPSLTIKSDDLRRAKENVARHPWAKAYADKLDASAKRQVKRLTPAFLEQMIPATTPGDRIFTPCPSCRDQGKSYLPHGLWDWDDARPEQLKCLQCDATFPNEKYPETLTLHAKWGGGQTLTFYGGEPFPVFGYKHGRPSFSANIRSRKVSFMADLARSLAEAHALTGNPDYARGVKRILLRLAEVYPRYLVHVGYGEYVDLDPAVAATHINSLPVDELVYPPNKPDRKLHTGYWSAGRSSGTGMEGVFVRRVATAYDLTCSTPGVWTDVERRTVERDLLLNGTTLLTADPAINNKSVTNRTAGAMVGMTVGEPGLVHWGLEGFYKTIDGWFLKDGGTPESSAYALMALNGVEDITLAARGYSDPAGYRHPDGGTRLDDVDLFRHPTYERVWDLLVHSLQGDFLFPPLADSHRTSTITPRQAELLAANYPDKPEYRALLKEVRGQSPAGDPSVALYYRDPAAADKPAPPLVLKDICPPELRIGTLRTGKDGRESLLSLTASHWGSHHHLDSLNLYYWKHGTELLSDLGYLWDHPKKSMAARTVAHNTVVVDESEQASKDRGGDVHLFETTDRVKVMRASSSAYPQASVYERTAVLVDRGDGKSYVVDFFRVTGGTTRDYVFHGVNDRFRVAGADVSPAAAKLYDFTDVRTVAPQSAWSINWTLADGVKFNAWAVPSNGETAYVADGWGQRDYKNADVGATIPYVVRRHKGTGESLFVSVFEGYRGESPLITGVRRDGQTVVLTRADGGEDRVVSSPEGVIVDARTGDAVENWFTSGQKRTPGEPGVK